MAAAVPVEEPAELEQPLVEEAEDAGFMAPQGYAEIERRRYDDTEFTFLRS